MTALTAFNASIGIIGGADGPTSVFISGSPITWVISAAALAAAIALAVFLIRKKKKK